jgi:hypothetical protein
LFEYLLRRHYAGEDVPLSLDEFLVDEVGGDTPLGTELLTMLRNPEAFFRWLGDQWVHYVESRAAGELPSVVVPFERPAIRVYMDTLFLEGKLRPVEVGDSDLPGALRLGVLRPTDDKGERVRDRLRSLDGAWPLGDVAHEDWLRFARDWAELRADLATLERGRDTLLREFQAIQNQMEVALDEWLRRRFGSLQSLAVIDTPVTVAQIAHVVEPSVRGGRRVALIVVDGMALDHWVTILQALNVQKTSWAISEYECFAWVPSVTSISRQAIFAGRIPALFSETWNRSDREGRHLARLGQDWGIPANGVHYARTALGSDIAQYDPGERFPQLLDPATRLLGIVLNDIDSMAHGTNLGLVGIHDDVRLWASR